MKSEIINAEARVEDDYNSNDDISREESSREENPSFYDNMESDETEEESCDISKNKSVSEKISNNQLLKTELGKFICFNMIKKIQFVLIVNN